jgi:hypothetical protein
VGNDFANRGDINTVKCAVVQISISSNMTVFIAIPRLAANYRQALGLLYRLLTICVNSLCWTLCFVCHKEIIELLFPCVIQSEHGTKTVV